MAMDCSDHAARYRDVLEQIDKMPACRRDLTAFVDHIYAAASTTDAFIDGPIKDVRAHFLRVAALAILAV